jgi:SAM-dependent methyltransferase
MTVDRTDTAVDEPAVVTGNTYDKYATTNPIEQKMMAGFLRALDEMLDGLAPTRILEVGVGEGEITERLRARFTDAEVVGVDLPDATLAAEWRRRDVAAMFADATALPFADHTFDLVLAIEVLEHVPQPERALAEIARVGRGPLIASVPFEPIWRMGNMARRRYLRDLGNTPGHVNHWTRWGFTRFVSRRFAVTATRSPLPWTMVRGERLV